MLTQLEIAELAEQLLNIRLGVDVELAPKLPVFHGKPYPLGRCREIRDSVYAKVHSGITDSSSPFASLFKAAWDRGIKFEKVWGDLRGEYFQNAIKFGDWYIDVANDTVDMQKPKIEILPWQDSGMRFIRDYNHFAEIARRYWQVTVYANTVFPKIAPILPLTIIYPDHSVSFAAANDFMINLTRSQCFQPSLDIASSLPATPKGVAMQLRHVVDPLQNPFLNSEGDALTYINAAQSKALYKDLDFRNGCVQAFLSLQKAFVN